MNIFSTIFQEIAVDLFSGDVFSKKTYGDQGKHG